MKLTPTLTRVTKILEEYPETRDSDTKLYQYLLKQDIALLHLSTGAQVLDMIGDGKVTHFESCRRARQVAQRLHPELRGLTYGKRKTALEQETRQQVRRVG